MFPRPVRKRWYEVTQPTRRLVFPTQSRKQLGGYATQPNLPWQCSPAPVRKHRGRGYATCQGDGVPSAPAQAGLEVTQPIRLTASGKLTLMVFFPGSVPPSPTPKHRGEGLRNPPGRWCSQPHPRKRDRRLRNPSDEQRQAYSYDFLAVFPLP